jgi:hypothetical protein
MGAARIPTVLLPANTRRLAPLPERRRRAFRDYFTRSLSLAAARLVGGAARAAMPPHEEPESHWPRVDDEATRRLLAQACGVCRGLCCEQGGEHAFQRPEVVRGYMLRHPGLRPRDVLAMYLDHLPTVSYAGSCVFHTRNGCNLPPDMRSRTCHEYLCEGLQRIVRGEEQGRKACVFAAAMDGETPVRADVLRRACD